MWAGPIPDIFSGRAPFTITEVCDMGWGYGVIYAIPRRLAMRLVREQVGGN